MHALSLPECWKRLQPSFHKDWRERNEEHRLDLKAVNYSMELGQMDWKAKENEARGTINPEKERTGGHGVD